jgi:ribosomal protein S6--L-glutamate ligase
MMQELAGPGAPMPTSFMPRRGSKASEALDRLGGAPVVVKSTCGSKKRRGHALREPSGAPKRRGPPVERFSNSTVYGKSKIAMKIWLLTNIENRACAPFIMAAARNLGHEIVQVHPMQCHVSYGASANGGGTLSFGENVFHPQLVLTRLGSTTPDTTLHLLKYLEQCSIPCINSSNAIAWCRDKTYSYHKLSQAGVPIPKTVLLGPKACLDEAIEIIPGPPWVVKLPRSSKGLGVLIADSLRSLKSSIDVLHGLGQDLILQEAITEANGSDIRVLVVGGVAVAAMRRSASGDDFRSNLFLGGAAAKLDMSNEVSQIAEQAVRALQVDIAGVDLLESKQGPVVIEVNNSPGLVGIQEATGLDLASDIISFVVNKAASASAAR